MKNKKLFALIMCFIVIFTASSFAVPEGNMTEAPEIVTSNYILVNSDTGEELLSHNAEEKMAPASTTKIMTALLALENLDLEGTSKVSYLAVNTIPWDSSKIDLREGEEFNNRVLIEAMMVASGNDAANVLAEAVSGDIESFVELMNRRAEELGCTGTHFANTHGYTQDNHYTTVSDMAKIAKKAMENPVFREIVKTTYYELPKTEIFDGQRSFYTTNNLLTDIRTSAYKYDFATGIKTGYTSAARNCLVASAEKEGVELISVIFGASNIDGVNMAYKDTKALMEWGFENYESKKIVKTGSMVSEIGIKHAKGANTVKLIAKEDFSFVMVKGASDELITKNIKYNENIIAPVAEGEELGTMEVSYDGKLIGTVALVSDKAYEYSWWSAFFGVIGKIIGIFILIILAVIVVLVIIRQAEYEKRKKERMKTRNRNNG